MGQPPLSVLPRQATTLAAEHRAIEVQGLLADRGQHRAPSLADLLIADVTGQPVERLKLR